MPKLTQAERTLMAVTMIAATAPTTAMPEVAHPVLLDLVHREQAVLPAQPSPATRPAAATPPRAVLTRLATSLSYQGYLTATAVPVGVRTPSQQL